MVLQLAAPHIYLHNTARWAIKSSIIISLLDFQPQTHTFQSLNRTDKFPNNHSPLIYCIILELTHSSHNMPTPTVHITSKTQWKSLAPLVPGGYVVAHYKPTQPTSCVHHGTPGFYVGPAFDKYRSSKCYMPVTGVICVTNTLQYIKNVFYSPQSPLKITSDSELDKYLPYYNLSLPHSHYCNMNMQQIMLSTKILTYSNPTPSNHVYQYFHCHPYYQSLSQKDFNYGTFNCATI